MEEKKYRVMEDSVFNDRITFEIPERVLNERQTGLLQVGFVVLLGLLAWFLNTLYLSDPAIQEDVYRGITMLYAGDVAGDVQDKNFGSYNVIRREVPKDAPGPKKAFNPSDPESFS